MLMRDMESQERPASLDQVLAIGGMSHFTLDLAAGRIAGGPLIKRLLGEPDCGDAFSVTRLLDGLDERTGRQLAAVLANPPRPDDTVDLELATADRGAIATFRLVGRIRADPMPILAGVLVDESVQRHEDGRVRRRASDRDAASQLEQFTTIVSHDLKSPLRGVHHLARFLRVDLADAASPQVLEHLDKLDRQVAKMSRMLDDLQAYVQVDRTAGKVETVDLEELGEELGELVGLPDDFTLDIDVEPLLVETDRAALSLVLRNLLDNGCKHHDRSAGTLRLEARPDGRGRLKFMVVDDGPGIPPCYRKRVFKQSQRLGGTEPGSGIGLALVKRAVKRQGGRIWIADAPAGSAERGVAFCFTWPLVRGGKADG